MGWQRLGHDLETEQQLNVTLINPPTTPTKPQGQEFTEPSHIFSSYSHILKSLTRNYQNST